MAYYTIAQGWVDAFRAIKGFKVVEVEHSWDSVSWLLMREDGAWLKMDFNTAFQFCIAGVAGHYNPMREIGPAAQPDGLAFVRLVRQTCAKAQINDTHAWIQFESSDVLELLFDRPCLEPFLLRGGEALPSSC